MRRTAILATLLAAACLLPLCACDTTSQDAPEAQQSSSEQIEILDKTGEETEPEQEPNAENAPEAQTDPEPEPEAEPEPEPEPELEPFDTTAPVTTATSAGGVTVTAPDGFLDTLAFKSVEEEILALTESGYHVGVVMRDLATGNEITYNTDERLYPASSIKATFCASVCEKNGGSAGMASTMERCLVDSSNEDFEALINTFGLSVHSSWLQAHGATAAAQDAAWWYYPEISAGELASAWQEIYRYGTSGEAGAGELTGYLARTNSSPIGNLLREKCAVWSKPGWFPDNGELVATNDAGVVFSESGPYVMVIMTTMSSNLDGLLPLIEALDTAHATMCGA